MIIVSDTTTLNYLILVDEAHILRDLFGKVLIPQAVFEELQRETTPDKVRLWVSNAPSWMEVCNVSTIDSTLVLGRGECEAISLAVEVKADKVLLDDRKARRAAIARGISVMGTLGILDEAAGKGLIDLKKVCEKLENTNFRVPAVLIQEILDRDAKRKASS